MRPPQFHHIRYFGLHQPHEKEKIPLYLLGTTTCADSTTATARQQLRPLIASAIASGGIDAQLAPLGILPQVHELMKNGGQKRLEAAMPDAWIDQLAITGTPEDWSLAIRCLVEVGANTAHAIVRAQN